MKTLMVSLISIISLGFVISCITTKDYLSLFLTGILFLAYICFSFFKRKIKNKKLNKKLYYLKNEVINCVNALNTNKSFKSIQTNYLIKKNEFAFLIEKTNLQESRSVRHSTGRSSSMRIMKGVSIGRSVSTSFGKDYMMKIDVGNLVLTNNRLIFDGNKFDRSINLKDIISVNLYNESIEISVNNKQKSMVFDVTNPFIWQCFIYILINIDNPFDLSNCEINYDGENLKLNIKGDSK